MMGIAGGLVWHEIDSPKKEEVKKGMLFFCHPISAECIVVVFVLWAQKSIARLA